MTNKINRTRIFKTKWVTTILNLKKCENFLFFGSEENVLITKNSLLTVDMFKKKN